MARSCDMHMRHLQGSMTVYGKQHHAHINKPVYSILLSHLLCVHLQPNTKKFT